MNAVELLGSEFGRLLLLAAVEFDFGSGQLAQTILPIGFQAAGYQSILRFRHPVAALGSFGLVSRALGFQAPLCKRGIAVGLQLLDAEQGGLKRSRSHSLEKGSGNGLVDAQATDVEAVQPPPVDEIFAGAVVAGRGVSATIVSTESAATVSAGRDALQQRATFSQRAP